MLIIYISLFFSSLFKQFTRFIKTGYVTYTLIVSVVMFVLISILLGPHIISKISHYVGQDGVKGVVKIIIIAIPTIYYAKNNRKSVFFIFIPIALVSGIIGAERVFILAYFLFLYFALQVKGGFNLGVIVISCYTAFKSYSFLYNLITYGNGFYVVG